MAHPVVLAGKYAILRRLGAGGMAEVFLAKHIGPGGFEKLVVIKRTLPERAHDEEFKRMFVDEARCAADLRHRNVVDIYEIGEEDGRLFMVMEFLHGRDLSQLMNRLRERHQHLAIGHLLQIALGAAEGLHYAHTKTTLDGQPLGLVHRDVSPQNLLVTFDGATKLVDFGVARASQNSFQTDHGTLRGKVAYFAPEQIAADVSDARLDQFALGIVLHELATLSPLFHRDSSVASLKAVLTADIPPPSTLVDGFPRALERVIMRCLERGPDDRYPDCGELVQALEDVAEELDESPSPRRLGRFLRRFFADVYEDDRSLGRTADAVAPPHPSTETAEPPAPSRLASAETGVGDGVDDSLVPTGPEVSVRLLEGSAPHGQGAFVDAGGAQATAVFSAETEPFSPDDVRETIERTRLRRLSNVPAVRASCVGRDREVDAIEAAFQKGARVVTVSGTAGVGKTRIALAVANRARGHDEEVWFCDLVSARTADDLVVTLSRALEVATAPDALPNAQVEQLGHALAARPLSSKRAAGPLLVLDNFEQLPEDAADLVETLVTAAPNTRVLVTSRQRLNIDQESVVPIVPLALPQTDFAEDIRASPAVALFLARAEEVQWDFNPSSADLKLVARIVERLEGLPLAIELAAARLSGQTLADLDRELAGRLHDAIDGNSGVSQRTLRGALEWSWDLLTPAERVALAQCTVFRGGFSLEAAEAVVDFGSEPATSDVAPVISKLCDRSLLRAFEPADLDGEIRYDLYVAVREYAEERLDALGTDDDTSERHARFVVDTCGHWARHADGPGGLRLLRRLGLELDNLVAVVDRTLAQAEPTADVMGRALRALLAMDPVVSARGFSPAHKERLDIALEKGEALGCSPSLLAMVHEARGDAHKMRGRLSDAWTDYDDAVTLSQSADDVWFEALALRNRAEVERLLGRADEASASAARALALFRNIGDRHFEARVLLTLGRIKRRHRGSEGRDLKGAADDTRLALDIFRHVGDRRFEGRALGYLARVFHDGNALGQAHALYEQALVVHREVGELREEGRALFRLGSLHRAQGHLLAARSCLEQAQRLLREVGDRLGDAGCEVELARVTHMGGDIDDARARLQRALAVQQELRDAFAADATRALLHDLA